jgi:hypothetical protein
VPRGYEKEGAYEGKTMIERGLHMQKNKGKGAYDGQNEGHGPLKMFFALQISKSA